MALRLHRARSVSLRWRLLTRFWERRRVSLTLALVFSLAGHATAGSDQISPAEAKGHVGEVVTVCGIVASTRYAAATLGQPTFLNLEKPYPNQIFTIVIWGNDREKFGQPEVTYRDKRICVTGFIKLYRGIPEVVPTQPDQIHLQEEKPK